MNISWRRVSRLRYANSLNNLADVLRQQGKTVEEEAESISLMQQALDIEEAVSGGNDAPDYAKKLMNFAHRLRRNQSRMPRARKLSMWTGSH